MIHRPPAITINNGCNIVSFVIVWPTPKLCSTIYSKVQLLRPVKATAPCVRQSRRNLSEGYHGNDANWPMVSPMSVGTSGPFGKYFEIMWNIWICFGQLNTSKHTQKNNLIRFSLVFNKLSFGIVMDLEYIPRDMMMAVLSTRTSKLKLERKWQESEIWCIWEQWNIL